MSIQLDIFDDFELFSRVSEVFGNFEDFDLEYKSAAGGFPTEFWKTYSAFANSQGGLIILGVKEKKGALTIEGLSESLIHTYKKHFWDNANNPNTVSCNLLNEADIHIVEFKGKQLLLFRIPAAQRNQKPVHLTRNPFGNTYKRNYEGDYRCNTEEVRRMLADADNKVHQDSRILEGFTFDDIDQDSLKKYRQFFSNSKPSHPWLILDDEHFLEKLGGYRKDRISKKEGLTLAGLIMFGKSESITDQECAPNFFPDFRENLANEEETRWTDRIYPDGTWEANLFNFYLRVWPKLSSSLPKPFQLKSGVRKDETPAHVALRESFINSLIHADYTAPGNIVIVHQKNHFSFSNPGTLLVSLHQYYEGGISECRNPSLQRMFLMIGSAEKAGSGVNKIMAGWEYAHWRRPFLRIGNQPDRIILELPMFSIIPETTLDALRELFGPVVDRLGVNELTILATCHIEGDISNNRLQYLLDLHRTDITSLLQELSKSGFLIPENKGRWTIYRLNESLFQNALTTEGVATSDTKGATSNNKGATSHNKGATSNHRGATSGKKSRLARIELFKLICDTCEDEHKTLDEIAKEVGKAYTYLKNKVIQEMIDEGYIERLHPNINHPHQAYKSTGKL